MILMLKRKLEAEKQPKLIKVIKMMYHQDIEDQEVKN